MIRATTLENNQKVQKTIKERKNDSLPSWKSISYQKKEKWNVKKKKNTPKYVFPLTNDIDAINEWWSIYFVFFE